MKSMLKFLMMLVLIVGYGLDVEAGTISRPTKTFGGTSFINGVVPDASDFNGDIDTIYSEFNGSVSNANISSSAAIAGSKITPNFTANVNVSSSNPCLYLDESDQASDLRRWYLCVTSTNLQIQTRTDAAVIQNTWMAIARSTGQLHMLGASPLEFEGATDNAFETTFLITDPTADRSITFPNSSGTVVFADGTNTWTAAQTFSGNATFTDVAYFDGASPLVFEGATADAFETTFAITDPTADRTLTIPNSSGTIVFTDGTNTWSAAQTFSGNATFVDEVIFSNAAANASDTGRLRRNGNDLHWHDGTSSAALNGQAAVLRGHIDGLNGSRDTDTAHDVNTTAGEATDDGAAVLMVLASEITKRVDATWAVGNDNGGLDTGSIGNADNYHRWLIRRSDTGVVDVLVSLSQTSPTMPSDYDQKRYIGTAGLTDGSANFATDWIQDGDRFMWAIPVSDAETADPGTSAVTVTLTIPTDAKVFAGVNFKLTDTSFGQNAYGLITSLDRADTTPTQKLSDVTFDGNTAEIEHGEVFKYVRTNTSGQVRYRVHQSDGGLTVRINTYDWIDQRGRDS